MIRKAGKKDIEATAELAVLLWSDNSVSALAAEFSALVSSDTARLFLAYENDVPVGFAQCQLRYDYVEGTETSPVGYLEGIFVRENCRKKGHARELLAACEAWARDKGCREFASDCELDNTDSFQFHIFAGFTEANRVICFTKRL